MFNPLRIRKLVLAIVTLATFNLLAPNLALGAHGEGESQGRSHVHYLTIGTFNHCTGERVAITGEFHIVSNWVQAPGRDGVTKLIIHHDWKDLQAVGVISGTEYVSSGTWNRTMEFVDFPVREVHTETTLRLDAVDGSSSFKLHVVMITVVEYGQVVSADVKVENVTCD